MILTCLSLVDTYASYFGSLTCVAWSPDGRLILVRAYIYQKEGLLIMSLHIDRRAGRSRHCHFTVGATYHCTMSGTFFFRIIRSI